MAGFLKGGSSHDTTWTVSQLTGYIRELFEIDIRLQDVTVTGEISNFTRARSGHLYFTLKDNQAQLKCVMWRSAADRMRFAPDNGDAVVAHGRISVYEVSGVYQLYAEHLEPTGRGDLALAFERLKQKLEEEGLFDPVYKKPLPLFPQKIGIVTSADAAALRDILNVLQRRCPLVSVLIAPTLVQGEMAPPQIVRALQWLDGRSDIDTIIVARGGGSMEDLWAFNDEQVARAIFAAHHPVISGVGHETDFTIADFVADLRAPTPSAAAELAVPDLAEIRPLVQGMQARLVAIMQAHLAASQREVDTLSRALTHLSPRLRLDNSRQRVDMLAARLDRAMSRRLDRWQNQLLVVAARLTAVGPLATLSRGYAIVRDANGRIIRSTRQVTTGAKLSVQVEDGAFDVTAAK
jgi:exodeoxyribonuclease VII large subunit